MARGVPGIVVGANPLLIAHDKAEATGGAVAESDARSLLSHKTGETANPEWKSQSCSKPVDDLWTTLAH
jgi:hypothetical protein